MTKEIEKKILEAFDSIHQLGVVHNDIRTENILVAQPEGSVWIIDFENAVIGDESLCAFERQLVKDMINNLKK